MVHTTVRLAALAALLAACAPAASTGGAAPADAPPTPGGTPAPSAPAPADSAERPAPRALTVPPVYRQALEAGTRSASGAPGPRYWQQRVRYRIQAELNPRTAELSGTERIVYVNRSPAPVKTVALNLYQNLFAPPHQRPGSPTHTGGVRLERVAAQGQTLALISTEAAATAAAGYTVDGTMGSVILPRAVASGDSVVLEIAFRQRVPPRGAPRTAYEDALGGRAFQVAQWYPQIAVLDDVVGMDRTPYLGSSEFYLEYGDFDVSLTLPAGWVVGATGELRNPEQVLPAPVRQRLARALASDSTLPVVTEADLRANGATLPGTNGKVTWRFTATDVRDFAFVASDRYVWDALRAVIPDGRGATRDVAVHALYRPRAVGWNRAARYGEHSVEILSRVILPYQYPQVTISEGPEYGMEYPMLVFIGRPGDAKALHEVIAHEVAHEWFPMMVGQDEGAFPWMDEGFTTFHEAIAVEDFFPGSNPWATSRDQYLGIAGRKSEAAMMRHGDQQGIGYGVAAYFKPGTMLRGLRAVVGDSVFHRAMTTYAREWAGKHPYPWDFFQTVERVSGRELDWFWEPWWFRTVTMDHAVASVTPIAGGVRVTVRDAGDAPAPALVAVVTAQGDTVHATIPGERFAVDRRREVSVDVRVPGTVTRVELDPRGIFPDTNRRNNVWRAPAPTETPRT